MNTNAICSVNRCYSINRSQVITVRSIDEWRSRLMSGRQTGKLMVVEFITSGGSHCKLMEPTVEEFAGKYSHAEFIKIDMSSAAQRNLKLASQFALKGYPTFVLIKEGKQVDKVVGAKKEELRKKIEQHGGMLIITPSSMVEWKALSRACKEANKLMVVSFKGPCTPCDIMHKAVVKFANKYTNVQFVKIDVPPENPVSEALVKEFEVGKCPTIVLVKNEKQVDKIVGPDEEQLMSKIVKHKVDEYSSSDSEDDDDDEQSDSSDSEDDDDDEQSDLEDEDDDEDDEEEEEEEDEEDDDVPSQIITTRYLDERKFQLPRALDEIRKPRTLGEIRKFESSRTFGKRELQLNASSLAINWEYRR